MRVALVAWDFGAPTGPLGVMSELVLRGHERFDFVVVSRTLIPQLRPLVEWRRAPAPAAPFSLKWAVFYLTAGARLARVDADVIHTWGPAPMVPNRVHLASVNFDHTSYQEAAGARPSGANPLTWHAWRAFTLALERRTYGGARVGMIDVESPGAKAAFERHYPGASVSVTPRSIDSERFRPNAEVRAHVRAEEGARDDEVVALFVARNWHVKGLDLAVSGVAGARQRGHPVVLWVAGRRGFRALRRVAKRFGVSDHVRLLGFRTDVDRIYAAADVFLLPTLYEIFCRACHEAAASELPVVATAVPGVSDLIGDDEAGIVVEREPRSIAEAVSRLAADPELRADMGRAGRQRVLRCTPERSADRWLDLYERVATGSS
jgi:glycosyltransferase involved in cell wall biosynthesis